MIADLSDPRHARRDCRDIVRILQFNGVFTKEEITSLLRAAAPLAAKAARDGKQREYKAAMDVLMKAAKLEQDDQPKDLDVNVTGAISVKDVVMHEMLKLAEQAAAGPVVADSRFIEQAVDSAMAKMPALEEQILVERGDQAEEVGG